jgi:hypothetical protein
MSEDVDLRQLGLILHQRMLNGDRTATAEIAEIFLPHIAKNLHRRYPQLDDPHLIETATEDAIISYFQRPEQFNPNKRSLGGYLRMSANGDLLNSLDKHKVDATQETLAEIVELDESNAEYGVEVEDEFDLETEVFTRLSPVWERLKNLLDNPMDQEMVLLMMENVRETSAFADVLGILDQSEKEQFTIVQRHKDRLKKTLQRHIDRSELSHHD